MCGLLVSMDCHLAGAEADQFDVRFASQIVRKRGCAEITCCYSGHGLGCSTFSALVERCWLMAD